jgi:hypothetical protein
VPSRASALVLLFLFLGGTEQVAGHDPYSGGVAAAPLLVPPPACSEARALRPRWRQRPLCKVEASRLIAVHVLCALLPGLAGDHVSGPISADADRFRNPRVSSGTLLTSVSWRRSADALD